MGLSLPSKSTMMMVPTDDEDAPETAMSVVPAEKEKRKGRRNLTTRHLYWYRC